jgi:hypothetical protein
MCNRICYDFILLQDAYFFRKPDRVLCFCVRLGGITGVLLLLPQAKDIVAPSYSQATESIAPAEPVGLYYPVDFCIPIGPVFNFVKGFIFFHVMHM